MRFGAPHAALHVYKNDEERRATLSTAARTEEQKCVDHDDSSGDELPSLSEIFGPGPPTATGLTCDSSDWPDRIGTLADTDALAPAGIVPISSVNLASSRL